MSLLKIWNGIEWVAILGPSGLTGATGPAGPQGPPGTGLESLANLGAGEGVFAQVVGQQGQFKSLTGGSGIGLTSSATEIDAFVDLSELVELGPTISGLYYRKDENIIPTNGELSADEVFSIGDFDTDFTRIHAASGVFDPGGTGGKVILANPDSTLECAIEARGKPTFFPALVLRGGRAVVMETDNVTVTTSGFWMGPTQDIIMGDIEDYSFDAALLYQKELANFGKKVTSVLVGDPFGGAGSNHVGHYTLHKTRIPNSNPIQMVGQEITMQSKLDGSFRNRTMAARIANVNLDDGVEVNNTTQEGINTLVMQSGGGTIGMAKAGYMAVDAGSGTITNAFVLHLAPPSGTITTNSKSLWCEGESCFGDAVQMDSTLDVDGLADFFSDVFIDANLDVEGDTGIVGTLIVEALATLDQDLIVNGDSTFNNDVSVSGCLETEVRRDASRRETFTATDNIAFDRNLIYGDSSGAASTLTITDPGKNGQVTKLVYAQNSTGTVVLSFSYSGGIRWRGGSFPGLSPVRNGYDIFTFLYDSTDDVLYGDYAQGFV